MDAIGTAGRAASPPPHRCASSWATRPTSAGLTRWGRSWAAAGEAGLRMATAGRAGPFGRVERRSWVRNPLRIPPGRPSPFTGSCRPNPATSPICW